MRKKIGIGFVGIVFTLIFTSIVIAEVPNQLNFQGRLLDGEDRPLTGTYSIVFSIYDVPQEGAALWTETQSVEVEDGIYNCILGAVTPLEIAFDKPYYLEVNIGNETLPRVSILSSAYSLNSLRLDGKLFSDFALNNHDHLYLGMDSNIGIGIDTPSNKLHVVGGTMLQDGEVDIRRGGDNEGAFIDLEDTAIIDKATWRLQSSNKNFQVQLLDLDGINKGLKLLTLDSSGNLGIGTATPKTTLDVIGTGRFEATGGGIGILLDIKSGSGNAPFILWNPNSANNNRFGIRADTGALRLGYWPEGGSFATNLQINSNGNVGIGTTAPGANLHIIGSADGVIRVTGASGSNAYIEFYEAGAGEWRVLSRTEGTTDKFEIQEIGVGTRLAIVDGDVLIEAPTAALLLQTGAGNHAGVANKAGIFAKDVATLAELFGLDEAGNVAQLTPHDPITGEWIFYSKNINTGRVVRVKMERLMKRLDELLGGGYFEEYIEKE